jgi:S1-C subfamily serine protease
LIEFEDWEFPEESRPRDEDVSFDLEGALSSVVSLRSEIPDDAYTASALGTERGGNGVVIADTGLVLTIGYLITEAETIWLVANNGTAVPAHVVGYDQASGFGLVQALGRLGVPAMQRGSADNARVGSQVVVAGHGGRRHAVLTEITSKHEFAGYWEYVLDEAIFTTPAHPLWGGAALIGDNGKLVGIGSLLIQERYEDDETVDSNMFVPIDLLEPILDDLMKFGKVDQPPRPWLGLFTTESDGNLVVAGLTEGAPADEAGVEAGDVVVRVADTPVTDLVQLFRRIWAEGPAGTVIPLTIERDGGEMTVEITSADRETFLKSPGLH